MSDDNQPPDRDTDLDLRFGSREIDIDKRWETASIANDVMVALWFLAGSILFLNSDLVTLGTWFFVVGSAELLARPALRLGRRIHIRRVRGDSRSVSNSRDF